VSPVVPLCGSRGFTTHCVVQVADADPGAAARGVDGDVVGRAAPGRPGVGLAQPVRDFPKLIVVVGREFPKLIVVAGKRLPEVNKSPPGRPCVGRAQPVRALIESQGKNLALTALYVPNSLDSGCGVRSSRATLCRSRATGKTPTTTINFGNSLGSRFLSHATRSYLRELSCKRLPGDLVSVSRNRLDLLLYYSQA